MDESPMVAPKLFEMVLLGEVLVVRAAEGVSGITWDDVETSSTFICTSSDARPQMVMNLRDVVYVGAVLLAFMLRLNKYTKNHGGKLVLCTISESAKSLLNITALDTIWSVYSSEDEAIAALSS